MYDIKMLKAKKLAELIEIAEQIGIKAVSYTHLTLPTKA